MSSFVIVSWQHGFKLQIMMVSQRALISDFEKLNQYLQIASQTIYNDKVLLKRNTKMDQIMWFYIMSSTSFFIIANKVIIALT